MFRLFLPLLLILPCSAQNPADLFKKAPPDIDRALRERITKFYQHHVDGKFRLAEQLVAEDSKDAFYAANKPNITGFRIDSVEYTDDFSNAKATIVGKMVIMIMGFGNKPMDVPFPSYWKVENGQWCWYINFDAARTTPFGHAEKKSEDGAVSVDPREMMAKAPDLKAIMSQVKADRNAVHLLPVPGSEQKVTITNGLPGVVTIRAERDRYPGLEVKLDRAELKGGEKAVVSFRSMAAAQHSSGVVRIIVAPTNQPIDIEVTFN